MDGTRGPAGLSLPEVEPGRYYSDADAELFGMVGCAGGCATQRSQQAVARGDGGQPDADGDGRAARVPTVAGRTANRKDKAAGAELSEPTHAMCGIPIVSRDNQ